MPNSSRSPKFNASPNCDNKHFFSFHFRYQLYSDGAIFRLFLFTRYSFVNNCIMLSKKQKRWWPCIMFCKKLFWDIFLVILVVVYNCLKQKMCVFYSVRLLNMPLYGFITGWQYTSSSWFASRWSIQRRRRGEPRWQTEATAFLSLHLGKLIVNCYILKLWYSDC